LIGRTQPLVKLKRLPGLQTSVMDWLFQRATHQRWPGRNLHMTAIDPAEYAKSKTRKTQQEVLPVQQEVLPDRQPDRQPAHLILVAENIPNGTERCNCNCLLLLL
jgi:hypothetical protein